MEHNNNNKWTEQAKELLDRVWHEVFEASRKVVEVHLKFGFTAFHENINPKIEDIVLGLKVIDSLLDAISGAVDEYTEQRKLFNCRQQILLVQEVATALQNFDKDFYEQAMGKLDKQSPI